MARAFWRGTISFGLVSIPVRMFVGTESHPIAFHLLHKKCLTRPHQVLHCDKDNEDITIKDTVKGYEYSKDQFVVLDEKDFANVPVKTTHTIEIAGFVRASEIKAQYYNGIHYLEPDKMGEKPFLLLREALVKTERVAVARVAFAQREHLCCLRPTEDSIMLHTLYYNDEILPHSELAPKAQANKPEEVDMAISLVNVLSKSFEPEQFHDEYKVALRALIEAKLRGKPITAAPAEATAEIPDLMAAMRASILAAKKKPEMEKVAAGNRKKS
jgi:DNA end-binding protein Ku